MCKKRTAFFASILIVCFLTLPCFADVPGAVVPGGKAIGLTVYTDGVYVTDFSKLPDSPAEQAGVMIGDRITQVNGAPIHSAEELPALVNSENGNPIQLTVERDGKQLELTVQPILRDADWKLGIYVRDKISGIGTLTYYDPESGRFGALGHAISDINSEAAPLLEGEVRQVEIVTVEPGKSGAPGALIGAAPDGSLIGTIDKNLSEGVFGMLAQVPEDGSVYPIAEPEEIRRGSASILCTVSDETVREYAIEIVSFRASDPNGRNLRIRVTDAALLSQTGGIVQGISGAPILQDGKLIGAVTHVLVDQPEQGYGIYIGNMLRADQIHPAA